MKTFSPELNAALANNLKKPVWLLKLELVSPSGNTVLYLADQPVTLWGQEWKPAVMGWGAIDRYFDPSEYETKVSDVSFVFDNSTTALGPGLKNISWYFRKYDLSASKATFYLWLADAGLTEPSGVNLNDLTPILTGTPELSGDVTPALCPIDVITDDAGEWAEGGCKWGELLSGRYSKNQWGALPAHRIGDFKPFVFGSGVLCEGIALTGPEKVGEVTGPNELFDPATGADYIDVTFPKSGENNEQNPFPAPCDIFIGDWRFTIRNSPEKQLSGAWKYKIDKKVPGETFYVPTPLKGATPIFTPSSNLLWPLSGETGKGPYSSSEPKLGTPYQFYHGAADSGNDRDGYHPGQSGAYMQNVYINGIEATGSEIEKDDAFGIVWLKTGNSAVDGAPGNPEKLKIKWTASDGSFTAGDEWVNANQLTANYPYGYHAGTNPCLLGDFAVPASGGGAPASSKLGLKNAVRYPYLGARIAEVRFVMRYTGLEYTSGLFNLELFGTRHSFAISELDNGKGILNQGFWVVKEQRGVQFEVWPNNSGYPYTAISPDQRYWDMFEISKDVTAEALTHLKQNGGFADTFKTWVTGTTWPDTNSLIVLSCELEVSFEPVESALAGPRVTALIGSAQNMAGDILSSVIPAGEVGSGFSDGSLPPLKYKIGNQQSVCKFIRRVTRESNTELIKNPATGKWDLIKKSDLRDKTNPPPPTGGVANIVESDLLADEYESPVIKRKRSSSENVVNEVTVHYIDSDGANNSVTLLDQGSIDAHGIRRYETEPGAAMTKTSAEQRALDILNANSEVNDYYIMTFPLGQALTLEPNDILSVTASMDEMSNLKMRVVSVEVDPGALADGLPATVTVNAMRFSKARKGFGQTVFGQATFGAGQIMEN